MEEKEEERLVLCLISLSDDGLTLTDDEKGREKEILLFVLSIFLPSSPSSSLQAYMRVDVMQLAS